MIEPTETESKESLDAFARAMNSIAQEAKQQPSLVKEAPTRAYRQRLDEVQAARKPILKWKQSQTS
jgi:glycine dehydrogenase subunit 2